MALRVTIPLLALVLSVTCANTPTSPGSDGASKIVVNDPARVLQPVEEAMKAALESTLERVLERVPALRSPELVVTVSPDSGRAIGGYGVGGFTHDARRIDLFIDPGFPQLASVIEARVSQMVAHEAHHALRFRGPGYGRTLLEAVVSEGLADHFSIELLNVPVPPWSRALPDDATDTWLAEARPLWDSDTYGHERWFFGTTPQVPRWTGYTLGYRLVERYKAAHPGATSVSLAHVAASVFRPPS